MKRFFRTFSKTMSDAFPSFSCEATNLFIVFITTSSSTSYWPGVLKMASIFSSLKHDGGGKVRFVKVPSMRPS